MKGLIALAVASAVVLTAGANATDLGPAPTQDSLYDDVPESIRWTGPYVGGRIGYGHANHDLTINEYFRDYCEGIQDGPAGEYYTPEVGFADIDEHGEKSDIWKTVDNKIAVFGGVGDSCETLAKLDHFGPGSHFTVPGDSREIGNIDGISSRGVIGGFQIGIDQQLGNWVVGAFGSYDLSNMETTATFDDFSARIEKDDEWSLGLRAGRLFSERTLGYVLVAYTQTDYNFTASPDVEGLRNNVTFDGVSFGGGLEHALTPEVFVGIEGVHTIYQDETIFDNYDAAFNHGFNVVDDLSETKVMGTVKVKFN